MKISRPDPLRRRRSPLPTLLILALALVTVIGFVGWLRGGEQSRQRIEIVLPPEALGR
jgi:hypothetical protein